MPTTKSAEKRLRQNEKRRLRNRSHRSALRTALRKVRETAAAGQIDEAQEALRLASKRLDQAAAKGVIHKNAASRTKSRLSARVKKAKEAAAA